MFSEKLQYYAQEKYESRLPFFGEIRESIEKAMDDCTPKEQVLMKFFYGTMPLRDTGEYSFELFLSFVKHAIWIYEEMEWCQGIPEDIFLHHILYYRINTENIENCRRFFYDQLIHRVKDLSLTEAILEINYWCAENGTYEASDMRTISPLTLYRSGKGRCGEESTFVVTAFRSMGIPARQVYTPRWAHCDDNHAWVEVFVDGTWHFLGACEPEEVLDKGWFTNASSRTLLVHGRTFSDYFVDSKIECLEHDDLILYYNQTQNYALTKTYEVHVVDSEGIPIENAYVSYEILNLAEYYSAAHLYTDEKGIVSITMGLGNIHVTVSKDGYFCDKWISNEDKNPSVFVLKREVVESKELWVDMDVHAPKDYPMNPVVLTWEQKQKNRARIHEANQFREARIAEYYNKDQASPYPEEEDILQLSAGNFGEVYRFLSKDQNPDRKAMIRSLSIKDYKDISAELLESHLSFATPYGDSWKNEKDREIFIKYILCPRVWLEELTDYRPFIETYFSKEQKQEFQQNPRMIWDYIQQFIAFEKTINYQDICSTPVGCLRLLHGSSLSKKIAFISICRTLGIPARINSVNMDAELYEDGVFVALSEKEESKESIHDQAKLRLYGEDGSLWIYYQTWTIGKLVGDQYVTLDYTGLKFSENSLDLVLVSGQYRLITTVRLPNGNQNASEYVFELCPGENKSIELRFRMGDTKDMLVDIQLDDFDVNMMDDQGNANIVSIASLMEGSANILAILSEGQEPTEHVLNEMLNQVEELSTLEAQIIFLLQSTEAGNNKTLQKVLEALPKIQIGYVNFDDIVEQLARRMYLDPEKLPLYLVASEGLRAVYGCSGYNVGSVDMSIKLLGLCR